MVTAVVPVITTEANRPLQSGTLHPQQSLSSPSVIVMMREASLAVEMNIVPLVGTIIPIIIRTSALHTIIILVKTNIAGT